MEENQPYSAEPPPPEATPPDVPRKLNPWQTKRYVREVETCVFTKDGPPLTFFWRRPFAADVGRAMDIRVRIMEMYVTGSKEQPSVPFFDGIELSEALVMMAAFADAMQPPDAVIQYTAEEYILWSDRRPNDWLDAVMKIKELAGDWLGPGGK